MDSRPSRHLTVPCTRCGRAAAEIALLPATETGESMWHGRDRLERTDFLGTVVKFGAYAQLLDFFETLCRGEYAAVRADDADFVAFYCETCGQVYCDQCCCLRRSWALSRRRFLALTCLVVYRFMGDMANSFALCWSSGEVRRKPCPIRGDYG